VSARPDAAPEVLTLGGVPLARAFDALRRVEPSTHAFWLYDLDALEARARRFLAAFQELAPLAAYALKANALPALLERLREAGVGAEAGSLGELEAAARAGFAAPSRVLNGNGRTREEADWAARERVALVNADHVGELDLLDAAGARAGGPPLRVALRVNPGIETPGHRYVSTGGGGAKFGVAPAEALEAWAGRARWPHLTLDGVHIHVGSQLLDPAPLEASLETTFALVDESRRRGAPLGLVNLGSGFGVDYSGAGAEFPLERHAAWVARRAAGSTLDWVLEPGRWLVAPIGVLIAEVLWIKQRDGRRFVVLAAGMNDLLRPALYGAAHRIEPVAPRPGRLTTATVVGPVCESADVFAEEVALPPLEPGDLVAIRDAGAYGAAMSSNYNGRGRLAEVVASNGRLHRARAGETAEEVAERGRSDVLALDDSGGSEA
jgi:diaminopimelate decarboxylase